MATNPRPIRRLSQQTINRIAAGEVVERPASVVKELVENALDAGARQIDVRYEAGGRRAIIVSDDGSGMGPDDLVLAIERHATSKLGTGADDAIDLLRIHSMGFRGEALPSIGAVARLSLTSQTIDADNAWQLSIEGGKAGSPSPAPRMGLSGTRVEVRDLFYATPARLKFLKSERSESMAITDILKRLAMARADVGFSLHNGTRSQLSLAAEHNNDQGKLKRLADVLGQDFENNALLIDAQRDDVHLTGYAGLPTYSRGSGAHQYLFVNDRPVRDKLLYGALRGAYQDFLARGRYPVAALYVELDPQYVDVNVHPAKTEVRFRDPGQIRGLIVGALRHALAGAGHRAATTTSEYALGKAHVGGSFKSAHRYNSYRPAPVPGPVNQPLIDGRSAHVEEMPEEYTDTANHEPEPEALADLPLGVARAQLHETYVVAQTDDGIVIVDQHAAHERLVYERMKQAMAEKGVERQALLIPDIVDLGDEDAHLVLSRADELASMGTDY